MLPLPSVFDRLPPYADLEAPRVPASSQAKLLDGRALAAAWSHDVSTAISAALGSAQPPARPPGLAVLLVGECVDSLLYVRRKRDACAAAGIHFRLIQLPEETSQEAVLCAVREAVDDPAIHGVLVQLPLPRHMDEETVLEAVCTSKDVDGFHPLNAGRLSMRGRTPAFVPCTPKGCLEMLRRARIPVLGAHCVVLGNSNTVGTPLAMLLRDCGAAAVTVCHSVDALGPARTEALCRSADILVAAVGRPHLVRGSWVKPGAAVLDVGINAVPLDEAEEDTTGWQQTQSSPLAGRGPHMSMGDLAQRQWRIVGDVAFDEVAMVAGAITPVPGGVGPMTIAALLDNTLHAWLRLERPGGPRE
jgi:methylenetetrahydrofolate dehydrogenase (NADP+)/methenyltetrahydrofolate cyclohydrolase